MSIQPGDVFLFVSQYRRVEEHCIVVEVLEEYMEGEKDALWKIFVVEAGVFDREWESTLLTHDEYRRVV